MYSHWILSLVFDFLAYVWMNLRLRGECNGRIDHFQMLVRFLRFGSLLGRPIISMITMKLNIWLTSVRILTLMASRVPTSCGPLFGSWIRNSNGASLSYNTWCPSAIIDNIVMINNWVINDWILYLPKDGSISSMAEKSNALRTDYWVMLFIPSLSYSPIILLLEFISEVYI